MDPNHWSGDGRLETTASIALHSTLQRVTNAAHDPGSICGSQ